MTFLHPFDDAAVIHGQGTIGLEILEQVPEIEAVVVPIGGGGLDQRRRLRNQREQSRDSAWLECRQSGCRRCCARSKRAQPVTLPAEATIADGIAVRRAGDLTLQLVRAMSTRL